jgi:CubicO group peptidase (beta-lactamase class C family)
MSKKALKFISIPIVLLIIYFIYANYSRLNIISGYSAKNMSSSVFLAGRSAEFTDNNDNAFSPINLAVDEVNYNSRSSTASVYGLMSRKAIYRDGIGSVLITDDFDVNNSFLIPNRNKTNNNLTFPYGDLPQKDTIFKNIEYNQLHSAIDDTFDDNEIKKTRAVLVIYKDHIIAEKYADSLNEHSIILGWSMTKSITATIFGILQKQGKLNVNDKAAIESWQADKRANITINDLLHMNSGLEWDENYNTISDVTKMLFLEKDMAKVQENKPLTGATNNSWNYSSGTTNLLSGMLRKKFKDHQDYLDFWYTALIDKIGMNSMLIETDEVGNYVGSSYGWATARDWAKFGLLYLHSGNWHGAQIFDEAWVDYIKTPTSGSSGQYGAHFWLNAGGFYPDAPRDLFSANGFQGQRIFIIPSADIVIVRMGLAGSEFFDFNEFLKAVLSCIN